MTTYNTGNKLGSTAVKDLYDNAENLDVAVNDRQNETWRDRFNVERLTWAGIVAAGTGDPSAAVNAAAQALDYKHDASNAADAATNAANAATNAANVATNAASDSLFYSQESQRFANAALGVGQTWRNMINRRSLNTTYTNTTGRAIVVQVSGWIDDETDHADFYLVVDGEDVSVVGAGWQWITLTVSGIVPAGSTYSVMNDDAWDLITWAELR